MALMLCRGGTATASPDCDGKFWMERWKDGKIEIWKDAKMQKSVVVVVVGGGLIAVLYDLPAWGAGSRRVVITVQCVGEVTPAGHGMIWYN